MSSIRATTLAVLILSIFVPLAQAPPVLAGSPSANPAYQTSFPVELDGERVRASSIALGDVDGNGDPDIVVSGADGVVHAYSGNGVEMWTYDTGAMAIESKAAIAVIDDDGSSEVVVTAGSTFTPNSHGGLYILDHNGNLQCEFQTLDSGDADLFREGVYASPAVADLDGDDGGKLEIVFGAWDRFVRVIHDDCTLLWENFVIDTVWSSAAIGDIDRDGQLDVVIGVPSDDEPAPNGELEGGILHVYDGATGDELTGFPIQIDETIQSSPALGDLTGDGWLEIVVGTGRCWADPACAPSGTANPGVGEYLNAWDHNGDDLPGWPVAVPDTYAFASPALADIDNDGRPEVIINTINPSDINDGQVYALNADGSSVPGWPTRPTLPASPTTFINFSTAASPVVGDVTGDGDLEVILPSNWDLVIFDKDGNQLSRDSFPTVAGDFELRTNQPVAAAAAIGDIDGDGDLEIVVGGVWETPPDTTGAIYSWDFPAADSSRLEWPVFRGNSENRASMPPAVFVDGFETGDLDAWTSTTP